MLATKSNNIQNTRKSTQKIKKKVYPNFYTLSRSVTHKDHN